MSAVKDFALPDLGEGLTESELIAWRVAVGDRIALNQVVADVETAKAVVELPSPFAGVVTALHAEPGDTVDVGAPLFSCEIEGGADASAAPPRETQGESDATVAPGAQVAPDPAPAAPPVPEPVPDLEPAAEVRQPTLVGYGAAAERGPKRRPRPGLAAAVAAPPAPPAAEPRTRSTPPVRRLARELGVDLGAVHGTGERGRVVRADVLLAAAAADAVPATAPAPAGAEPAHRGATRIPIRGVRKHTAAAMVRSAFTAPHVTEFLTVDATPAMELLRRLRDDREFAGHRITPLALVARAVCLAVRRTPEVNASWDEERQEIVQYAGVNLGIAAATGRGLVVPNIRDADRLGLAALADAIGDLAATAREGRTPPSALTGGTITITNVGVFGVDAGTPILNPGEAAILAFGQVRRQPWEHEGGIALREVVTLSLSFDHRLVDGEQGSRFLVDVGRLLADPGLALAVG